MLPGSTLVAVTAADAERTPSFSDLLSHSWVRRAISSPQLSQQVNPCFNWQWTVQTCTSTNGKKVLCYYLKIGKTFGDVSCHYQGGCEENVNKYQYYIFMHVVTGGQRSGRLAPFNWNIRARSRTFSPFMMEPDEKLLEVHHYKTERVNYVNVHEATCPEANGFHRFHVLPMFICSRDNENHTCVYHLLGTDIASFPGSPY